jgi:hypothetical protein
MVAKLVCKCQERELAYFLEMWKDGEWKELGRGGAK